MIKNKILFLTAISFMSGYSLEASIPEKEAEHKQTVTVEHSSNIECKCSKKKKAKKVKAKRNKKTHVKKETKTHKKSKAAHAAVAHDEAAVKMDSANDLHEVSTKVPSMTPTAVAK